MSTLEKAIGLLKEMPENKLEAVYMYIRFVDSQTDGSEGFPASNRSSDTFMGTTQEYTNPESSPESALEKRQRGFQGLMSFAGTLPEDFDYKKELEEARDEKYARFI